MELPSNLANLCDEYSKKLATLLKLDEIDIRMIHRDDFGWKIDVRCDGETVSESYVSYFPGCCGIAVSHNAVIFGRKYSNKGVGTLLNELRIKIAKAMGYNFLTASDVTDNLYQDSIFIKNGWKVIDEFKNTRTRHTVKLWSKDLSEVEV